MTTNRLDDPTPQGLTLPFIRGARVMRSARGAFALLGLPAVLATSGCAAAGPATPHSEPRQAVVESTAIDAGVATARADSIRNPYTEADIRFMRDMIGHHAQAIVMAEMAPERSATPMVRTLASRIISSQRDEIETMRQWLRNRNQPVPAAEPTMDHAMHGHAAHAHHSMPGMLSAEQLRRLSEATGPEFDRLFLTYMIQHHQGAVTMVTELFQTHGAGQDDIVFRFASGVHVDQLTEIARMRLMLIDLIVDGGAH